MLVVKIAPINLWHAPGAKEGNIGSLFSSGEIVIFIQISYYCILFLQLNI